MAHNTFKSAGISHGEEDELRQLVNRELTSRRVSGRRDGGHGCTNKQMCDEKKSVRRQLWALGRRRQRSAAAAAYLSPAYSGTNPATSSTHSSLSQVIVCACVCIDMAEVGFPSPSFIHLCRQYP